MTLSKSTGSTYKSIRHVASWADHTHQFWQHPSASSDCNSVENGGPVPSIAQHNPQQFHMWLWIEILVRSGHQGIRQSSNHNGVKGMCIRELLQRPQRPGGKLSTHSTTPPQTLTPPKKANTFRNCTKSVASLTYFLPCFPNSSYLRKREFATVRVQEGSRGVRVRNFLVLVIVLWKALEGTSLGLCHVINHHMVYSLQGGKSNKRKLDKDQAQLPLL